MEEEIIEETPIIYNRYEITEIQINELKETYQIDIVWNVKSKKYNVFKDGLNVLEFDKNIDIEKELINYLTAL
jgi:hypothetical protein